MPDSPRGRTEASVSLTAKEREAVLHIIGKLADCGRAMGWATINGARVDALASATEKLKEA